jgi:hypothetical protein
MRANEFGEELTQSVQRNKDKMKEKWDNVNIKDSEVA